MTENYVLKPETVTANTLLLVDIDGVINADPFNVEWAADFPQPKYPNSALWNSKNWKNVPVVLNEEEHFVVEKTNLKEFGYPKMDIYVSKEIVNWLKELQQHEHIQVAFLSMWEKRVKYFNKINDTNIPYLPLTIQGFSDIPESIKTRSFINFITQTPSIERIVWVDDTIFGTPMSYGYKTFKELTKHYPQNKQIQKQIKENLLISPNSNYGINRKEQQQINRFLFNKKK